MPKDCAVSSGFAEDVDAKSATFFTDIREIEILTGMQTVALILAQYLENIGFEFGVGQRAPLEAGIKYILFGLVATGITLYGMSYLFGLTGTTDLVALMEALPRPLSLQPLALIGLRRREA